MSPNRATDSLLKLSQAIDEASSADQPTIFQDLSLIIEYESKPDAAKVLGLVEQLAALEAACSPIVRLACATLRDAVENYRSEGEWRADAELVDSLHQAIRSEQERAALDVRAQGDAVEAAQRVAADADKLLERFEAEWPEALGTVQSLSNHARELGDLLSRLGPFDRPSIRAAADHLRWEPPLRLPPADVSTELWNIWLALAGRYHDCRKKAVQKLKGLGIDVIAPIPEATVFDAYSHEAVSEFLVPTFPEQRGKIQAVHRFGFRLRGEVERAQVVAYEKGGSQENFGPTGQGVNN